MWDAWLSHAGPESWGGWLHGGMLGDAQQHTAFGW